MYQRIKRLVPVPVKDWIKKLFRPLATIFFHLRLIIRSSRYRLKNVLYRWTPGGFGYIRHLRQFESARYDHERDKHPIRRKFYGSEGWKSQAEVDQSAFIYRNYEDYDEYVLHQSQKWNEILALKGGFSNRAIAAYRRKFWRRFRHLIPLLPRSAQIVCAGARQGTEVEVLRDLGFKNAYGIDLNPGPKNPYVVEGDFMRLNNQSSSLDLLYTNCLDHAFNLEDFFSEHARVIKPDGYVLYDVMLDKAGVFEAVQWPSETVLFSLMVRPFKRIIRVERENDWLWILMQGKDTP